MTPNPGKTLSHYRLGEKISAGGMGVVYRAEDLKLQRQVALKLLPRKSLGEDRARARLLREARAAASLNHPNICTIYEVLEEDGEIFIAMELVEGETLNQILERSKPLPVPQLLDIAIQVAEGLAEAHAQQLVHRDLKPHNVMVARQGRVKILDFGLAKQLRAPGPADPTDSSADTISFETSGEGAIAGTIAYLSPEQAVGKEVDARSDLFSFGVMLYEMAAGLRPFRAEGATATIAKILESEPKSLREADPELPAGLVDLVDRCLRKNPEERFNDARELVEALTEIRRAALSGSGAAGGKRVSCTSIAVFPFSVRGSQQFAYLGEGIVDLLSTKLDGAGDLRCIDAHVVLGSAAREGGGVLTPERAWAITRRLGAGMFVLGNILEIGGQLHLDASLYECGPEVTPPVKAEVRGEAQKIFEMVDDLTMKLLRNRSGGPGARLAQIAAVTTGSFTALKAYLEGESAMRALRRTPAVEAFKRSVDADPLFALAWYRLGVAALWSAQPEIAREAIRQAVRHGQRLSERDSQLLAAFQAILRGANVEAERLYRAIVGAFPDDVEAWYQLAEILFHYCPLEGHPIAKSREAWERLIELDPRHANAVVHLGAIEANSGDHDHLERSVRRVQELTPGSEYAQWMRAMLAFARRDEAMRREITAELRRASDHTLIWAIQFVGGYAGDIEGAIRLGRLLDDPVRSPEVRALGHAIRAHLELARGRWEAAMSELASADPAPNRSVMLYRALLSLAPYMEIPTAELDAVRSDLERWDPSALSPLAGSSSWLTPHEGVHPHLRLYLLGVLSARLHDRDAAGRYAAELERLQRPDEAAPMVGDLVSNIRAHAAWADGQLVEALEMLRKTRRQVRFDQTLTSPFRSQTHERFVWGDLLIGLGRHQEAIPLFASFEGSSIYDVVYIAPSHLRRGEIHERLGQHERAADHYARCVELWRECDKTLRPLRDDAEARLRHLRKGSG